MSYVQLSNLDLFEELFEFIKQKDVKIEDALKEFGGSNFYVPSYKTTCRNDDIIEEYKENLGKSGIIKHLSRKYSLSEAQIYAITKEVREPRLF